MMLGRVRKTHFSCIDVHCGGEPARILLSAPALLNKIPGQSMAEKRLEMMQRFDGIRQVLLQEPRGYPCQNLNCIFPSQSPQAEFGYVIAEQACIYPLFSGHNTICVVTALLETGMVCMQEPTTEFQLESPGGLIKVQALCSDGQVDQVVLDSMPSFVFYTDKKIYVDSLKDSISVDVAFGGMIYAIVDIDSHPSLPLIAPENGKLLAQIGQEIKTILQTKHPVKHPEMDYSGPDILVFTSGIQKESEGLFRGKNTVVMSNGHSAMLDRSPCGSGTAAVMANLWHKGILKLGEKFIHESIIGSKFSAQLLNESGPLVGGVYPSVLPRISGNAFVTGYNTILLDSRDPFPNGFTVSDIW